MDKRCDKCGWINPHNASVCSQCNAPLGGNMAQNTPQPQQNNNYSDAKKTVRGAVPNMPYWDDASPQNISAQPKIDCKRCGYPNDAHEKDCANCGSPMQVAPQNPQVEQKFNANPPSSFAQPSNLSNNKKTMRIGDVLKNLGSQFVLRDINNNKAMEFSGDSVSLNRSHLDANNPSISSQEHVFFEFKNEKWQLTDKSSNGATFVQAVYPNMPLQNGMLIMIGNKIYRFESEQ